MSHSQVVYKYPLDVTPSMISEIDMPDDAFVVEFALQNDRPTIWAVIELDEDGKPVGDIEKRRFRLVGTGEPVTGDGWVHQGTIHRGLFVWHLFEDIAAHYIGEI